MARRLTFLSLSMAVFVSLLLSCASDPDYGEPDVEFEIGATIAIFDFAIETDEELDPGLHDDVYRIFVEAVLEGGGLRPLERKRLDVILEEQELSLSGAIDEASAIRVGKLAGARYALLGTIRVSEGDAEISCRVIDVETGVILFARTAEGYSDELVDIVYELAGCVEDTFSD
jgi:TolB-like protein